MRFDFRVSGARLVVGGILGLARLPLEEVSTGSFLASCAGGSGASFACFER